jgi:ribosomal protein S18 acetylase RimI-like enzyme
MQAKIQIEPAQESHKQKVLDLLEAQMAEHHIEIAPNRILKAIEGYLGHPDLGFILVARRQEEIVGIACVSLIWTIEHGGKSSWLEELYVSPEARGTGTGGQLLDEVIKRAKQLQCDAIDLEVESDHQRVEALYQRAGFRKHTRTRWVKSLWTSPGDSA